MTDTNLPRMARHATRMAMYDLSCRKTIAEHGWMIQGVFGTNDTPGPEFSYTVGLTAKDRPELMIVGLPMHIAAELLNLAAPLHIEHPFTPDSFEGSFSSVAFKVVEAPHAEIGTARRLYGDKATCLQLVWPDKDGHYPGDDGWPAESIAQPVYDVKGGRP